MEGVSNFCEALLTKTGKTKAGMERNDGGSVVLRHSTAPLNNNTFRLVFQIPANFLHTPLTRHSIDGGVGKRYDY